MAALTLFAAAISLAWAVVAVWIGPRVGYVDAPEGDPLKTHTRAAVPLGGVGVFVGVHAGLFLGDSFEPALLAASAVVVTVGLVDDRRPLPPLVRLAGWGVAAAIVALDVPPGAGVTLGALVAAATVLSIASVNLFDGLDGLAASSALVAAGGLALLAVARGADHAFPLLLLGALAGFLVLNWHPARVFLGDSGAYVVGVLLAWGMMVVSPGGGTDLVVAAGVLGVFVIDLVLTILRRLGHRQRLFAGDRSHVYDQMHRRGWPVAGVAIAAAALQAAFVAVVLLADRLLPAVAAAVTVAGVLAVAVGAFVLGGFTRTRD